MLLMSRGRLNKVHTYTWLTAKAMTESNQWLLLLLQSHGHGYDEDEDGEDGHGGPRGVQCQTQ